jgi:hypothetical protein
MSTLKLPSYGELHTIILPDGQEIEIDLRDRNDVQLFVNNSSGDCYESVSIKDNDCEGNLIDDHPSLSAAERNPSLS